MGLHSLNTHASKVPPPTVEGYFDRVVTYIDAHYEEEHPLHGYRIAADLVDTMIRLAIRVRDDLAFESRHLDTIDVYRWNLGALYGAIEGRASRNAIKRLVAEARRSYYQIGFPQEVGE